MSYAALPTLRTPRLTLRALTEQDADAIVDGVGNYDVSRWLGVVPYPYDRRDALSFIGEVQDGPKLVWGVEDNSGLIGTVSTEDELGYWFARRVWRKGYGFEAARAAVAHWFDDPSRGDLTSGYFQGNLRSEAVLRSLGFRFVGERTRYAKSLQQEVSSNELCLRRTDWDALQGFTLYTPRLTLRPMERSDAQALLALSAPEVARNVWNIPADWSLGAAEGFVADNVWQGYPGFRLAVVQGQHLAGYVGFGGEPLSVYFALAPDRWGQGVMTEALSAFLPELFRRFPMSQIRANHFVDNDASGKVLRKLGFERTGTDVATSKARLEPAPVITYAVTRETLRVPV